MRGPFGDTFLASPPHERVVPLELPRGYRDAVKEEREVTFLRYVGCRACSGRGCKGCNSIGWSVQHHTARVAVPPGAAPGTRITVREASHVVDGTARDLFVEIVQPGARAEQLVMEGGDYEAKLVTAWQMDEALQRRTRRTLKIGVLVVAGFTALAFVVHFLAKSPVGERCAADVECRSGSCLRLPTTADPAVCTATCETDLDCPAGRVTMHCAAHVCVPNDY